MRRIDASTIHMDMIYERPTGEYDAGFVAGWNRAVREITNQIAQAEIAYAQKYSRKKRGSAYDKCGVQAVSRGCAAAPEADTEAAQAADLRAVGGLGADHAHELGADAEREIP